MFDAFKLEMIDSGEAILRVRYGGEGPPVLLLHGHPQTHVMWHTVAPKLAQRFTVVAPDLRGYGESSKPRTAPDHEPYSKRVMALDQVRLMDQLGFERFFVAGHDRGGRVAYRMALDHPQRVAKLAVLDLVPTCEMWRRADMEFGLVNWHWYFLAQPAPFPEGVIAADPDRFYFPGERSLFAPEALDDYLGCVRNEATIHAMCEDYRAGATYDVAADEADRGQRRIACPVLALWSKRDELERWFDVVEVWRRWADDVRGSPIDSGHYLAEEAPEETTAALMQFFSD